MWHLWIMDTETLLIAKIQHFYDYLHVQLNGIEERAIVSLEPLDEAKVSISNLRGILSQYEITFKEIIYEEKL